MKALILALATALPQFSVDQSDLAKKIINLLSLDSKTAQHIDNLYNKTQIKKRYSILKDIQPDCNDGDFFNEDFLNNIPSTEKRNEIYITEAPKLALKAAQEVLKKWNRDPKEITHIISVSCTGIMAPGIEFILQQDLKLADDVQRIGINFMGCFGAFRGLAVASALAKENSNNRILLVCTELCSLHMQVSHRPEILIGNALFGDGAAAVIIGAQEREQETPLWSLEKSASYALENSQDKMTWKVSDEGLVMSLSRDVPNIIEQNAFKKISSFLCSDNFNNYNWAVHPGGKAIIEAIERSCNLNKQQTRPSWNVLADYGNMSSATFLFVLNELINDNKQNKDVVGIGFGPGLSLEAILLGNSK